MHLNTYVGKYWFIFELNKPLSEVELKNRTKLKGFILMNANLLV